MLCRARFIRRRSARRASRGFVELLEPRTLLSTLVVNGTAGSDTIVLGVTPAGGVEITLNGASTQYAPGEWTDVSVDTGTGNDIVDVSATIVPLTITGGGSGQINLSGPSGVQQVLAPIRVNGFHSGTNIDLNDAGDAAPRAVTITATPPNAQIVPKVETISGLAPADIQFTATQPGSGVNPNLAVPSVNLTTGWGDDTVDVRSTLYAPVTYSSNPPITTTGGSLSIDNSGGNDTVRVETQSSVGVNGEVGVGSDEGSTSLTIDDSSAAAGQYSFNVVLPPETPQPSALHVPLPFDTMTVVAAGTNEQRVVDFRFGQVPSVTLNGGAGDNTFSGPENASSLALNTGAGNDDVDLNVNDDSSLAVHGGTGTDLLQVSDFGSATFRSVLFDGGQGSNRLLVSAAAQSGQMPPAFILGNGRMSAGGDSILYSGVGVVQLENPAAWQVTSDLGPINLNIGGPPAPAGTAAPVTNPTTIEFDSSQHLAGLRLFAASAKLTGSIEEVLDVGTLSLLNNASLDLTDNGLRVHYQTANPFRQIRQWISDGTIFSSWSNIDRALGYADSADGIVPGLAPDTVLVTFALRGDANLDGSVNFADLVLLARNYGRSNALWDQGDFNGDGQVGFDDLVSLARNYGSIEIFALLRPKLARAGSRM